ncbi:MAG: hypothetical protein SGPRY_014407 [Prymnesium sp.]
MASWAADQAVHLQFQIAKHAEITVAALKCPPATLHCSSPVGDIKLKGKGPVPEAVDITVGDPCLGAKLEVVRQWPEGIAVAVSLAAWRPKQPIAVSVLSSAIARWSVSRAFHASLTSSSDRSANLILDAHPDKALTLNLHASMLLAPGVTPVSLPHLLSSPGAPCVLCAATRSDDSKRAHARIVEAFMFQSSHLTSLSFHSIARHACFKPLISPHQVSLEWSAHSVIGHWRLVWAEQKGEPAGDGGEPSEKRQLAGTHTTVMSLHLVSILGSSANLATRCSQTNLLPGRAYSFLLQADLNSTVSERTSAVTSERSVPETPSPPLLSHAGSCGQLRIEARYRVLGGEWKSWPQPLHPNSAARLAPLPPGALEFALRASNPIGDSEWSAPSAPYIAGADSASFLKAASTLPPIKPSLSPLSYPLVHPHPS